MRRKSGIPWLIIFLSVGGFMVLIIIIALVGSLSTEDSQPASAPSPEPTPTPTPEPDIVCDNHKNLFDWSIINETEDASLTIFLPSGGDSDRFNPELYAEVRAILPCDDGALAVTWVTAPTFDLILEIHERYYPGEWGLTPYQYCEAGKEITAEIEVALYVVGSSTDAISRIKSQIREIRFLRPAGKLQEEHAYFLALADALEAAIPEMEALAAGRSADATKLDAVTTAANTLTPVMRDVCDPSIIN